MEPICKAMIYHSTKSKRDPHRCANKAKDANGFCLRHQKKSKEWEYNQQYRRMVNQVEITVWYGQQFTTVRMNGSHKIGICLESVNQKFGVDNHTLYHNGNMVNLSSNANIFDGKDLQLTLGKSFLVCTTKNLSI